MGFCYCFRDWIEQNNTQIVLIWKPIIAKRRLNYKFNLTISNDDIPKRSTFIFFLTRVPYTAIMNTGISLFLYVIIIERVRKVHVMILNLIENKSETFCTLKLLFNIWFFFWMTIICSRVKIISWVHLKDHMIKISMQIFILKFLHFFHF
jgi:hypothetical protein